ncbi:MAG: cytochrome c oxidase assembly protein [Chloroflexota bacterium]
MGSRWVAAGAAAAAASILGATPVAAHGVVAGPPDAGMLLTGWSFDIEVWLPVLLAAWGYLVLVRSVDRAHPTTPVPRRRLWYWMGGLGVLLVATQSVIGAYDTTLFTTHMVQHLLLTMVAAPLLLLGAPVTLLLRAASPDVRKDVILPVLHSRVVRALSHPIVAWGQFAVVMWASHFTGLFDAALEDPLVHALEHALYLGSALLFWWPVVGVDPAPRRLPHPMRVGYLVVGMPFSSFLGLAIFSATHVLYQHYATLRRDWGQPPLEDQQWAGGIMWAGGDLLFLVAVLFAIRAWLRAEEAEARRIDSVLERDRIRGPAEATGPATRGEEA